MADKPGKLSPLPGFVKVSRDARPAVTAEQRSALIRTANEMFNQGKVGDAKRIFLTVGYSDGLIRVGDYHMKRNEPLEAFRMYWLAPDRAKTDAMVEKMARIVQVWLRQDQDSDEYPPVGAVDR
ncbi:MAG: hypothetical protein EA403_06010 [Spirochaetaceae bacterium]|nr:MAG: hypothetical protein EA403_06010 [Spirochaetaceae bacterium]